MWCPVSNQVRKPQFGLTTFDYSAKRTSHLTIKYTGRCYDKTEVFDDVSETVLKTVGGQESHV